MAENHQKPTPEELKAKQEEALKLAEDPPKEDEEPEETPEEGEPTSEEEDAPEDTPEEPEETPEEDQEPEPEKEEEQAEPSKEVYKKKFSASSRENQKINAKNRILNKAIVDANAIPMPTDDEMKQIYGDDWDMASDFEKISLKETEVSKKWRNTIKEASDQATKIEKWNDSVDEFITDPKTLNEIPQLEGKTDEFREFAQNEKYNSVPFEVLVPAFLHQHSSGKKPNKGRMFERSGGGPSEKPKVNDGKISLEEARKLRSTNYDKWKEYSKAGKIDYNV